MMQMKNHIHTPLYGSHWGMPQNSQTRYNNYKAPSKVVSIPVHFVGSEQPRSDSDSDSAIIKIQKVARGFLVRKSMKRIAAIRSEVEQIENTLLSSATVELMMRGRDHKERVMRVSETLMNLLLRLDSVRALHSGVRECRKSVINKAIALQEMLDQMVMGTPQPDDQDQTQDDDDENSNLLPIEHFEAMPVSVGVSEGTKMEALVSSSCVENEEKMEVEVKGDGDGDGEESVGTSLVEESDENYCLVKEEKGRDGGEVEWEEEEERDCCEGDRREEGEDGKREVLERMMEDNERMMGMMTQLFERNEMQTRLLSSLSHRVGLLERAFVCDKLRRKKKRNVDAKHKETHPWSFI